MNIRLSKEVLIVSRPNAEEPIKISYDLLRKAVLTLRALNHKLRKDILEFIESKGRATVTEIYVKLRLEQSVASQHLAILRRAKIVETEREGKFVYYKLNKAKISELSQLIAEIAKE
ncbi:MAG: metalloregulator ArsR/SmtB family transcription factor [Chitinophagales bacterium]|nr:metalloregulator ArsR/SmtB family transcription factor [Chitinophagales bacterium]